MRVLLKLVLDCEPDAAWRAIRSPAVLREISSPLFTLTSREPGGFPTIWQPGSHLVRIRGGGILPIGTHDIRLTFDDHRSDGVRIMRDSGGVPGTTRWDHRIAIAPNPAGPDAEGRMRTLYRDRLLVSAGALTPALWYGLWSFWQWRGARLRALAPTWAYDPPPGAAADPAGPAEPHGVPRPE